MTSTAQLTSPSSADLLDRDYTLDHKYTRNEGRIYLSGVQALVRLPLMQRLRDAAEASTVPASSAATAAARWVASIWSCGARASILRPPR